MIALQCSVQVESDLLIEAMAPKSAGTCGSKSLIEGTIAGREVVLCISGMGKVNAAHAATMLLARSGVDALIVFGIGGAYPSSGARIGDVTIATAEIAGDEGVLTPEGFRGTDYIGIPLIRKGSLELYNTFPAAQPLLTRARGALASFPAAVHTGPFVTVSSCTGTSARAGELEQRYHGLCENMEGAAAAQIALYHDVPWLEVRAISNLTEDRDVLKWDIPGAALTAQNALLAVLGHLDR